MEYAEQIRKATETGVYQEIVDQFLQPYWGLIAGQDQPLPAASEFERMAKELVESRGSAGGPQFTLPAAQGSKAVKLNDIREQVAKLAGPSAAGVMTRFNAIDGIPDQAKVQKLSAAVQRGVDKGSGWWRVFMADPLGMIGDLIAGLFTGTLKQRMGERFARSTSASVQEELVQLRQEPGMEKLLTSERVMAISEQVAQGTRQTASSETAPAVPAVRLKDSIKPLSGSELLKPPIEQGIRSLVAEAFNKKGAEGKSARDLLMAGQRSKWTLGLAVGGLKAHEADAVEKRVADAFVKVVTDDAYRYKGKKTHELTDAELKETVIAEVGGGLRKLHEERKWAFADKRVGGIIRALEERFSTAQIAQLRQASQLAAGQGLIAMMSPEAQRAAGQERGVRDGQGMSGPQDVPEAMAAAKPAPRTSGAGSDRGGVPPLRA